jgi:hypothetical protein
MIDASADLEELLEWKLDYEVNTHPYFSRDGGGAQQTIQGCEHGSGSWTSNFDATNPIHVLAPVGRLVTFTGTMASGCTASGSARIKAHHYNPKLSGEPQTVTTDFDTHGVWAFSN